MLTDELEEFLIRGAFTFLTDEQKLKAISYTTADMHPQLDVVVQCDECGATIETVGEAWVHLVEEHEEDV